VKQNALC